MVAKAVRGTVAAFVRHLVALRNKVLAAVEAQGNQCMENMEVVPGTELVILVAEHLEVEVAGERRKFPTGTSCNSPVLPCRFLVSFLNQAWSEWRYEVVREISAEKR